MKRIAGIIVLIVFIAGVIIYMGSAYTNNQSKQNLVSSEVDKAPQPKVGLEKGNAAPDFELFTPEGQPVKLSNYKGKKVILNLWATWCPPCRAEMPDMQKFYLQNKDDVVVLGINLTGTEKDPGNVSKFIKEFGLTFPIVLDKQNMVGTMYRVSAIPASYIIDANGVIQQKVVGPMSYAMMERVLAEIH